MDTLKIQNIEGGIVFSVKVVPGSSKTALAGLLDGMLKIKLAAPPEKGKANKSLLELLVKKLNVKKTDLNITSGQTSQVKTIEAKTLTAEDVLTRLNLK